MKKTKIQFILPKFFRLRFSKEAIISISIFILFISQEIFAVTNFYGDVVISGNTSWGEAYYYIGSLIVSNGAVLSVAGGATLSVSGDVTVVDSSSEILCQSKNITSTNEFGEWVGVGVRIDASNITVGAGASINADGEGYKITGSNSDGNGPGGGVFADYYAGGGGHGGKGGTYGNAVGGSSYGNAFVPEELGSAGACGTTATTPVGYGGGAIRLEVQDTLTLDGKISADGNYGGGNRAAGGAGGSILAYINNELTGSGSFTADGGDGGGQTGGGSGGRIAVYYKSENSFGGFEISTVDGGAGTASVYDGNQGTAGFFDTSVVSNHLYIYQRFVFEDSFTTTFEGITVDNSGDLIIGDNSRIDVSDMFTVTNSCTVNIGGGTMIEIGDSMNVLSNSTIICKSWNIRSTNALGEWAGVGVQINASNIIVAADASINADGQGYKIFGSNSNGNGPGGGVFADYYAGGGGHGGSGGTFGNAIGGSSYGDAFIPELIMAGEMMSQVSALVKPGIGAEAQPESEG